MGADDVAMAAVALKDEDLRRRVREGDLTAIGDRDLSPEEAAMVRRLAEQGLDPEAQAYETSALHEAFTYCRGKLSDSVLTEVTKAFSPTDADEVEGHMISRQGPARYPRAENCRFDSPSHCDYYYHNRW